MQIKTIPASKINAATYNPRKDLQPGDPEYKKLKKSLTEFGYVDPLVWNEKSGNLVGGAPAFESLERDGPERG
jgi:ParB-like chromosome segregation protein Spo0J